MDENGFYKEVRHIAYAISAYMIAKALLKRTMHPLEELLVVGVLTILVFGIGFFWIFPSGTSAQVRVILIVAEVVLLSLSALTHPRGIRRRAL